MGIIGGEFLRLIKKRNSRAMRSSPVVVFFSAIKAPHNTGRHGTGNQEYTQHNDSAVIRGSALVDT